MKTPICERLGCEVPIFAFTHCRDVVVEVTKAGGFGVLGASRTRPNSSSANSSGSTSTWAAGPTAWTCSFPSSTTARPKHRPRR